ncbi:type VII secretion protein [Boudabousia tangfeifanii]|uniref:ESAT-6-like protein n=1 Tax=Boudabousia tangfeifanii TaxID=1912795 RepID=A0A1D9ML58_9ACTO|nr:WXG100 family type VII secretion target [Boudabousia tangfeifanii]AOZ73037.1 type VII secretion protein [Boudabousia tangfeifanii]
MTTFQVDASQISAAGANAAATGNRIRSEVAGMLAQLHALEGNWQGAAQISFNQCVNEWQAVQAQVDTALESLSQRLLFASQTYQQAETQAQALFAH